MTTTSQPKIFTLEEFLAMPETKPASEFIAGSIEQKPMPQGQHSRTNNSVRVGGLCVTSGGFQPLML